MGHYVTGLLIVLALAVLTLIEFWVAVNLQSAVFLLLIAAIKVILVIWFFMHVKRLWAAEGGH